MKQARLIPLLFLAAFLCLFGECAAAVVRGPQIDPRDMAIDRQVGGMEEGSRISHPHHDAGEQQAHERVHGNESGVGTEAHATVASGAHNLSHSTGVGTGAGSAATHTGVSATSISGHAGIGASHAGTGAAEHHASVGANVSGANTADQTGGTSVGAGEQATSGATAGNQSAQEGNHGVFIGGNLGGETTGSETTGGGSSGTETAGSESSSTDRSIIEADTNVNLNGENPNASTNISVDTNASGGLLDANTTTNAGSTSQQITSPLGQETSTSGSTDNGETTGSGSSNYIVEADANLTGNPSLDVTVDTSAGGGLLDAHAVTDAGTVNQQILSESSHQTSSTSTEGTSSGTTSSSGSADRSVIEADTNVSLSGENPSAGANISVDTNASGGLVDLDTATNADTAEQELTSSVGLEVGMGANTITGESELGTEIGANSAAPPAGEAETGLEADVEGVGATEDTASDPADGLISTPGL
ncbi:MAG: hypothetical protein HY211_04065 [Candidatus Omnitrophica bacterium]|nr:hypothetical protein [Candidatus Omnitrophota bacterium]